MQNFFGYLEYVVLAVSHFHALILTSLNTNVTMFNVCQNKIGVQGYPKVVGFFLSIMAVLYVAEFSRQRSRV